MVHQDLSIRFGGDYSTRQEFSQLAMEFATAQVSTLAHIPSPGFSAMMLGSWDPPYEQEDGEPKDFDGHIAINRVMDPEFGSEWRGEVSITATGKYHDDPREEFRGHIHVFVIE